MISVRPWNGSLQLSRKPLELALQCMLLTVAALVHFRKNGFASENDFPPSTFQFNYEVRGEQKTSLLYRNDYVLPPPPPPPPPNS